MTIHVTLPGMNMDEKLHFADLPAHLLEWYSRSARQLPWRIGPGDRARGIKPDPYRVWLAEIMLQQTTVPHATRYYLAFTQRWPSVQTLAAAQDEVVMAAWAGLGYYARARNLLKCARAIAARGAWPETVEGLRELPGIGPYTAGAIAALAFGQRAAAVDGNVDRVFARLMALKGDWKLEKTRLKSVVEDLVPRAHPAEFAEALMDLGATICTPKSPNCSICPLRSMCAARAEGAAERYPIKPKKVPKPTRHGHVYLLLGADQTVRTERRPDKGLLGGMMGLPTSDWSEGVEDAVFPAQADWQDAGEVRHVFTHFALILRVWCAPAPGGSETTAIEAAADALPSVFAKALKLVV
ncbi:MAG: A/G-specific adenine glycosylase [Pseudomonadota bacterium]